MHHALEISDILGSIFKFTDRPTNGACVQVCRAWQDNALDVLWSHVDNPKQLFQLLGPMREIKPELIVSYPVYLF